MKFLSKSSMHQKYPIKPLNSIVQGTTDKLINHKLLGMNAANKVEIKRAAEKGADLLIAMKKYNVKEHEGLQQHSKSAMLDKQYDSKQLHTQAIDDIKENKNTVVQSGITNQNNKQDNTKQQTSDNKQHRETNYVAAASLESIMHSFIVSHAELEAMMSYIANTAVSEYLKAMRNILEQKDRELAARMDRVKSMQYEYNKEHTAYHDLLQPDDNTLLQSLVNTTLAIETVLVDIIKVATVDDFSNHILDFTTKHECYDTGLYLIHGLLELAMEHHMTHTSHSNDAQHNEIKNKLQDKIDNIKCGYKLPPEHLEILKPSTGMILENFKQKLTTSNDINIVFKCLLRDAEKIQQLKQQHGKHSQKAKSPAIRIMT